MALKKKKPTARAVGGGAVSGSVVARWGERVVLRLRAGPDADGHGCGRRLAQVVSQYQPTGEDGQVDDANSMQDVNHGAS